MMKTTLTLLLISFCAVLAESEYSLTRSEDISECERQASILETHLESKTPVMEPVSGMKLGIHWKSLLNNQTMECLESVELLEGLKVVGTFGKSENHRKFAEKQPFEIKLDICKENQNNFKVFLLLLK